MTNLKYKYICNSSMYKTKNKGGRMKDILWDGLVSLFLLGIIIGVPTCIIANLHNPAKNFCNSKNMEYSDYIFYAQEDTYDVECKNNNNTKVFFNLERNCEKFDKWHNPDCGLLGQGYVLHEQRTVAHIP